MTERDHSQRYVDEHSKAGRLAMKYVAVLEPAPDDGWGAYVSDLPGCVAVAETQEETERLIREAIPLHIESLREEGERIPEPGQFTRLIEV